MSLLTHEGMEEEVGRRLCAPDQRERNCGMTKPVNPPAFPQQCPDAWEEAFERAADGFAVSVTKAMLKAFELPPPPGLEQPQHCLAILCGPRGRRRAAGRRGLPIKPAPNRARSSPPLHSRCSDRSLSAPQSWRI